MTHKETHGAGCACHSCEPPARPLHEIAAEAYAAFETAQRPDGESYDRVKDDAPEWISDLVREAHSTEMLPDDWRYASVRSALEAISDSGAETRDDLEDVGQEWADGNVDVYTGERLAWLSSHSYRPGYCDEAASDFGAGDGEPDLVTRIGWGQYRESEGIFARLVDALEDLADADD